MSALDRARTLADVVQIGKQASAWAKAIKTIHGRSEFGLDAMNAGAEIMLRAQRKGGQILAGVERTQGKGGGRGKKKTSCHDGSKFKQLLIESELAERTGYRWLEVSAIPQSQFESYIREARKAREEISTARLLMLIEGTRRDVARNPKPKPPKGTYRCLVVDPAWPVEKIVRHVRPNQRRVLDYPTMTLDQIRAVPVPTLAAADGCHLYLWFTHKFAPAAFDIAEGWGFNYECIMTWRKNIGFTPFSWMYSTEHVLFCRRGSLDVERKGLRLDFDGKVREHSRKPAVFYDRVRQVSPGPRLDMFSREGHNGFESWGNEIDKFAAVTDTSAEAV
jgi:N6-adenosine-specific RNA methylase IME4